MTRFHLAELVMPTLRIGACLFASMAFAARGQEACTASVLSEVEVGQAGFFLSDLLAAGSCPQLATAAAKVRLGAAPLAGSVRVLEGSEVRALLERVPGVFSATAIEVPERIRVRRAGTRLSCAEIEASLSSASRLNTTMAGNATLLEILCGARIFRRTPIEISASRWDAEFGRWELRARCQHREDCVPFLIRVRGPERPIAIVSGSAAEEQNLGPPKAQNAISSKAKKWQSDSAGNHLGPQTMVHRGQSASMVWDQQGIRVVVPSVSLDAGNAGDTVRARIARSGRIVRATVTGAGWLRVAS